MNNFFGQIFNKKPNDTNEDLQKPNLDQIRALEKEILTNLIKENINSDPDQIEEKENNDSDSLKIIEISSVHLSKVFNRDDKSDTPFEKELELLPLKGIVRNYASFKDDTIINDTVHNLERQLESYENLLSELGKKLLSTIGHVSNKWLLNENDQNTCFQYENLQKLDEQSPHYRKTLNSPARNTPQK